MAVRVLLVLAAFAILYDCDQANAPAERREQWEGVEKAVEDEQPQREQASLPDLDVMMNEDCSAGFFSAFAVGALAAHSFAHPSARYSTAT